MLIGKHCGWDEYGGLFAVDSRLECCADGDLCFSETYIAANQAVHWFVTFHVSLDCLGCSQLVGGIFIDK